MKSTHVFAALALGILGLVPRSSAALPPCGGFGQRGCCLPERTCQDGLAEADGCFGECGCSTGTCMPIAPCGGEGQRICCGLEALAPCQPGLTAYDGCNGNCRCGGPLAAGTNLATGTCGRPDLPMIAEPSTNASSQSPASRVCALSGYADLHMHLNTHLAHGGKVLAGEPAPINAHGLFELSASRNINTALSFEQDFLRHAYHDPLGDPVGEGTQDSAKYPLGAPYFSSWPQWTTTTHQQVYYKWLERAWQGGLRLMVQLAITNEALCVATHLPASPEIRAWCADSMTPIDRQLEATWDFQRFIDELCQRGQTSCVNGQGWFRIVREPEEARAVIARGQLAVVLGIEVDNLFNCKEGKACPNMRDAAGNLLRNSQGELIDSIPLAVAHYQEKGVRHIFPVHNFDNAFGAAAAWQDAIDAGQRVSEGRFWDVDDCGGPQGYGFWIEAAEAAALAWFMGEDGVPAAIDGNDHPSFASCNRYGLNLDFTAAYDNRGLGRELMRELMNRGMLIDVDHMSRHSVDDTLALARSRPGARAPYPLIAGHVQPFEIHHQELGAPSQAGRHERMRTLDQLRKIRADGGMIAVMTKDDVQDTGARNTKLSTYWDDPRYGEPVADNCRHSSKSFAQAYQYAVDTMGAPVALGTDFNGIAGHIGPRFGGDACGRVVGDQLAQLSSSPVSYPFHEPGFGSFSRQRTGYKTFDYNVDGLAHVGLLPDMVQDLKAVGLGPTYTDALFRSAEWYVRVWERAKALSLNQEPPTYGPALSCDDVPLCLEETNKPPPISCPAPTLAECMAGGASVDYPDPAVGPDDCGDTSFSCGPAAPGDFFPLGTTPVYCTASDVFDKRNGCQLEVKVVDTQAPQAAAPDDIGGIECESHAGTVVDVGSGGASDVCEANPWLDNDSPALFPYGTTSVTWTASDSSGNAGYDTQLVTVVDTRLPSIRCPERVTAECTGAHSAVATPGSATGSDICDASLDFTQYSSAVFPLGDTDLPYTATDDAGLSASCSGIVSVVDTTPPVIRSVLPTPASLWPPNHKLVNVALAVDAFDVCDAGIRAPLCAITDIESSEPEDGQGDGNTWMDWEIIGALSANLRAERRGGGPGRTYTLEVTCADMAGLTTTTTTTVTVPH